MIVLDGLALSSTTYFRPQFSVDDYIANILSVFRFNNIDMFQKYIVVNEYSYANYKNRVNIEEHLKRHFPKVIFIQKTQEQIGQAYSLNIIKDEINTFSYQLHWEEAWVCDRPFISDALRVMSETNISQLNLSDSLLEDLDRHGKRFAVGGVEVQELLHRDGALSNIDHFLLESREKVLRHRLRQFPLPLWPLYTLRPCINRISFTKDLPYFNTDNSLWPILFELLYAFHWSKAGGSSASLIPSPARYAKNYRSTWRG